MFHDDFGETTILGGINLDFNMYKTLNYLGFY